MLLGRIWNLADYDRISLQPLVLESLQQPNLGGQPPQLIIQLGREHFFISRLRIFF